MNDEKINQKNAIIISLILLLAFSLVVAFVALSTISGLDGQRSKSESQIQAAESTLTALNDTQAVLESQAQAAESTIAAASETQAALEDQNQQAQATISGLENELAASQRQADVLQSLALAAQARQALDRGESNLAIAIALEAVNIENPPAEAELILSEAAYAPGIRYQISLDDMLTSEGMAVHPAGELLIYGTSGGEIVVKDIRTGEEIKRFGHMAAGITSVEFSPDGRRLFASAGISEAHTYAVWDFESGRQIASLAGYESNRTPDAIFSSDGRMLYFADGAMEGLVVWDVDRDRLVDNIAAIAGNYVYDFAISPDGQNRMISVYWGEPGRIALWYLTTGELLQEYTGFESQLQTVTFAPDGRSFFTGEYDGMILQWEVATGKILRRFDAHTIPISALAVSPDGRKLLSNADGTILWDIATGEILNRFPYIHGTALAFSPNGQTAIAGTVYQENLVTSNLVTSVLDLQVGTVEQRFVGHNVGPVYAAFLPDSKTVISAGAAGAIENGFTLWDSETGEAIRRFEEQPDSQTSGLSSAALSPDGKRLLMGFNNGGAFLWDVEQGELIQHFDEGQLIINTVALSPDGKFAAAGTWPNTLLVWDVASGDIVHQIEDAHESRITGIAFSPDSQTLMTGSMDNPVTLWQVDTGERKQRLSYIDLRGYSSIPPVSSVAFSPDGTLALAVYWNDTVAVWDVQTAALKRILNNVSDAVFSTNGHLLTLTPDYYLEVWNSDNWRKLRRWYAGEGFEWETLPTHLAFSPDGQQTLAINQHNTMTSWRIDTLAEMIDWVHNNRYVPTLTCEQSDQYRVVPVCVDDNIPARTPSLGFDLRFRQDSRNLFDMGDVVAADLHHSVGHRKMAFFGVHSRTLPVRVW